MWKHCLRFFLICSTLWEQNTHTSQLVPSNHRLTPTISHGKTLTTPWATRSVHKNCLLTVSKFALVRSTTFAWHTQSPARTNKKADEWNISTKNWQQSCVSALNDYQQERRQTTANTVSAISRISTRSKEWWRVVETAHGGGLVVLSTSFWKFSF